jgi:hypothetical protein
MISQPKIIAATTDLVPNSYTPKRPSLWSVRCRYGDREFATQSRSCAVYALCRKLVKAGVPDMSMEIRDPKGKLLMRIASIDRAAKLTIKESPSHSIHVTGYREFAASKLRRVGEKRDQTTTELVITRWAA